MTSARWSIVAVGVIVFAACLLLPVPAGLRVAPLDRYGEAIRHGQVPYRDFSLEYPPGALPAIVVPAFVPGTSYTHAFEALEALFGCGVVVLVGLLRSRASLGGFVSSVAAIACAPLLLGPVIFHRFDLWPSLLLLVALGASVLGRQRVGAAGAGAAVAAKLYPLVVVVPLALRAARQGRLRVALAWGGGGFLVFMLPFSIVAPGGVAFSLRQQTGRHLQLESVGASFLALADVVRGRHGSTRFEAGAWDLVSNGAGAVHIAFVLLGIALVVAVTWHVWQARGAADPVRASAALVGVVLVASNVLSPQYLVWLVPLAAAAGGVAGVAASGLLAVSEVLTQILYPSHYEALVGLHAPEVSLLVARNLLLVIAVAVLVRACLHEVVPVGD